MRLIIKFHLIANPANPVATQSFMFIRIKTFKIHQLLVVERCCYSNCLELKADCCQQCLVQGLVQAWMILHSKLKD